MSYSEKEALNQIPEASSWPKFSGKGEYDHMELIDYIYGLFIDVTSIPGYWITARLNTEFKGHASIWHTEMKEVHGRRNWPLWKSQIIQKVQQWYLNMAEDHLEHAVKCRFKQSCTLDDIVNTLQDVRKRRNIGKYSPYKSSGFREKPPFRVEFKDNPRERVSEMTKKKNSCPNCGSTDHYANDYLKAKKKVYAIEKVPEDSGSDSMGDAIGEESDEEQDQREEFLVEYQEETPPETKQIHYTTKGRGYIHGTATRMTVCIENAQHPLIIESGAHCSIVAQNYLDHNFPNWEKQILPNKANNFKSESGKMKSIGTIIKEMPIPHRKGNIRLNPEFVVLEDAHIQGFLLGTDYQRTYGIVIYNSKNRIIAIGTNKEKKFSLDPLEELLNDFREGQFSTTLTSKIRGHDIKLYLDVERPYPPMLRRPPCPASLEARKYIEKNINELLEMDVIRKIGHNEIVENTTPVLIT
ncbi:hypothetical protein O181_065627 [Austropuccinia psidii MF-1]|uniref:Uncharacterized protein n=1 Tax=Austropuccinia psidii MF-1 TaxID=1389203 RepID=A0A9Q3I3G5_9BASI|nr:hypothetical protein [Austropuccinia psidii MF-1]